MQQYLYSPLNFTYERWVLIDESMVKSVKPYYYISNNGRVYSTYTGKMLKLVIDKFGYYVVNLQRMERCGYNERAQISERVNRLVLLAFMPIEHPELYHVHHIDGNRLNNSLTNLAWVVPELHTRITRQQYQPKDISGENNPMAKINNSQAKEIVDLINSCKYTQQEIANMYNVRTGVIYQITYGYAWKDVAKGIDSDNPRVYRHDAFSKEETIAICEYLCSHDINNKEIYPTLNSIYRDCFKETGLDKIYDFHRKRDSLKSILFKTKSAYLKIAEKYNYKYLG